MDNENNQLNRPNDNSREWKLIEKLVLEVQGEQRRARRWGIFFKLLTFFYLFGIVLLFRAPMEGFEAKKTGSSYVAVVEVNGVIAADQDASADNLVGSIREAFADNKALGLILRINSPGGSPVQAGYVYDEIQRLKTTRDDFPVYAVIMDLGASGAYYIAAAADEIYADKASLVGSIGVVGSGFGFTKAMEKLGIERRQYTSGAHKGFLDPFQPENPEEKEFWQSVLSVTHKQFIEQVRKGRGDRLKEEGHPELFSGLVWSGEQALELGLIDGLASSSQLAREKLGSEDLVDFTLRVSPWDEFMRKFGASMGKGMASMLTEQTLKLR